MRQLFLNPSSVGITAAGAVFMTASKAAYSAVSVGFIACRPIPSASARDSTFFDITVVLASSPFSLCAKSLPMRP